MDHSAHSQPPTDSEEENQQEESQYDKSYEGKLTTDLYRNHSSQNKAALEVFIVLSSMGVGYTKEVIDAYNLLKKPLDPKKLITDPEYRKQVQRVLQLVQRHEGKSLKKGTSKYTYEVNRTKVALGQIRAIDSKLETSDKGFISQFAIDAQRVYGLSDKEFELIKERALQRAKDYPGQFSPREALRIEARNISIARVAGEVQNDKNVGRFQKKGEVNKRVDALELDKKDVVFLQDTTNHHELQKQAQEKITDEGIQSVSFTLGTESKPQPTTTPTPPARPVQQPIIPKIPSKFTLPKISLPSINLSNFFKPLGNLFSGLKQGLGSIFGKTTSFIGDKINPLKIAARQLINRGLDAIAPGLGLAFEGLNKVVKQFTGIDFEDIIIKFALYAALFAVGSIVVIFVLIIMGTDSLFSTNTASNPITINTTAQSSTQKYSWKEFEEKYLTTAYSP